MRKIHIYCDTSVSEDARRRNAFAERTWRAQEGISEWETIRINPDRLDRNFDDAARSLPFVKDVINTGITLARREYDDDAIILTNADICFAPSISEKLEAAFEGGAQCCYAYRRDFRELADELHDEQVVRGALYPGNDLFAFTRSWWAENGGNMPDMLIGAEGWDMCLRVLMQRTRGLAAKPLIDIIYHEQHDSFWCRPENRFTLPSQIHNRALALEFVRGMPELERQLQ